MRPHPLLQTLAGAAVATVLLTACEADQPEDSQDPEARQAGGGMSQVEAVAPDPQGSQYSHDEMRAAVESAVSPRTVSDTDDWWGSLRDINRELQKLRVEPSRCKSVVTASALPVPTGALTVSAAVESGSVFLHSFEDASAALSMIEAERQGARECDDHTVIRASGDDEFQAHTELGRLQVRSGAQDALAVRRVVDSDSETQRDVLVLIREGSVVAGASREIAEDLGEDERRDLVVELEAEAAAALSELLGEDITAPEPEPEDDEPGSEGEPESDEDPDADEPDTGGSEDDGDAGSA